MPRGCLTINSRLCLPFAFFLLCFSPISVFSFTFCVSSFSSEALGFSAGNIHVVTVDCIAVFNLIFPVLHSVRVLFLFFLRCVCFVVCWASLFVTGCRYWFQGLFRGVFYYVLGVFRVSVAPLHFLWVVDPFGVEFKVVGSDCCV